MVIALAGRRVDRADVKDVRFPLENVEKVRARVRTLFEEEAAVALVSSAACGADLIALEEAGRLGLKRRVILPFARQRFRETSVTDRPGEWGASYDQILDKVEATDDLVVLKNEPNNDAYSAANRAILDQAAALAPALYERVLAVIVWDGVSRGDHDLTEEFGIEARKRGWAVIEVTTI